MGNPTTHLQQRRRRDIPASRDDRGLTGMDGLEPGPLIRVDKVVLPTISVLGIFAEPQDPLVEAHVSLLGVVGLIRVFRPFKKFLADQAWGGQILGAACHRTKRVSATQAMSVVVAVAVAHVTNHSWKDIRRISTEYFRMKNFITLILCVYVSIHL